MSFISTPKLFDLSGRVAVVTGASRGIGQAIAIRLADAGATVVGCDITAGVEDTIGQIKAKGGKGLAVVADITRKEDIARIVKSAVDAFGSVDILVNNAALRGFADWDKVGEEDWDRFMAVTLKGVFFLTQAVAKQMIAQGRGGAMVNIASTAALVPVRNKVDYNAAKAGVAQMTRSFAVELGPHRIRVNAVAPGGTNTMGPGGNAQAGLTPEQLKKMGEAWFSRVPLPVGPADPDDQARAVLFFVSDAASYVTGQVMYVDAGYTVG